MYQKLRVINRTVFSGPVLWLADRQALPPRGWCVRCGAEIYRQGEELCSRCGERRERGLGRPAAGTAHRPFPAARM